MSTPKVLQKVMPTQWSTVVTGGGSKHSSITVTIETAIGIPLPDTNDPGQPGHDFVARIDGQVIVENRAKTPSMARDALVAALKVVITELESAKLP